MLARHHEHVPLEHRADVEEADHVVGAHDDVSGRFAVHDPAEHAGLVLRHAPDDGRRAAGATAERLPAGGLALDDVVAEAADPLDLHLDPLPLTHGAHAGGGAGEDDVAGQQGEHGGDVGDQGRHRVHHLGRPALLPQLAVHPGAHGEVRGIEVHREEGPGGAGGVEGLATRPGGVGTLSGAGRDVVGGGVAEHVVQRALGRHVLGHPGDDDGELGLVVHLGGVGGNDDGVVRAGHRGVRLEEEQRLVGHLVAQLRGMVGIVASHAHHLGPRDDRGEQAHRVEVDPLPAGGDGLEQRVALEDDQVGGAVFQDPVLRAVARREPCDAHVATVLGAGFGQPSRISPAVSCSNRSGPPGPRPLYAGAVRQRIVGVDIARGLAILGMYIAHVGHSVDGVDSPAWFIVADGRPSALFAILAGLSIALFTGRQEVPHGTALVRGWLRVASRAVVIFIVGVLLMMLGTPVAVILPSYAVAFLLVTPFLSVRPGLVAVAAGAAAVVGPTLLAGLTESPTGGASPVERALGTDGNFVLDLLLTGHYPALVWVAYMLLGLFLGRLDLGTARVQALVGTTGVGLVVLGHGLSDVLLSALAPTDPVTYQLIRADPHADSTFELLGNAGAAMLTLAVVLALTTWPATARVARVVLFPVAAAGDRKRAV